MGKSPTGGLQRTVLTLLALASFAWVGVTAQVISTNTRLPALQWIRLDKLLKGSAPPPLKDASLGYDETTRTLLVFGGESSSGFPQGTTYLLDLDALTWKSPSPPNGLDSAPPARSAAIGGGDFAANSRHGHIVIGGRGADGKPLNDVWEFDYLYQYWRQVEVDASTKPGTGRYGAVGGIDTRLDPMSNGLTSSFYLAGGYDGSKIQPTSDVWRLDVSGILAPNVDAGVKALWTHTPAKQQLPSMMGQGSAVVADETSRGGVRIAAFGGCNTADIADDNCAQANASVLYTSTSSSISPVACAAARLSPAIVANMNGFDSSFRSQVLVLLGTFNSSLWDDGQGLQKGEVDVLDVKQGVWTRVVPAKDPQNGVPSPRQGAAVVGASSAVVGDSRSGSSDILVFGGKDSAGNYLSDIWLLRAYNGVVTGTNQHWTGYGNGILQTGVNAAGAGVALQYQASCATAIVPPPSSSSTIPSSTSTLHSSTTSSSSNLPTPSVPSTPGSSISTYPYNTNILHKVFLAVSFALCTFAVLLSRLISSDIYIGQQLVLTRIFFTLSFLAYGLSIAGLVIAFTTVTRTSILNTRSSRSHLHLKTAHGIAGLVLEAAILLVAPIVLIRSWGCYPVRKARKNDNRPPSPEKPEGYFPPINELSPASNPQGLVQDAANEGILQATSDTEPAGRLSSGTEESISNEYPPGLRSFEVTNRASHHARRSTQASLSAFAEFAGFTRQQPVLPSQNTPQTLGDVDWLERRRSLIAVDQLDYAMTQMRKTPGIVTPATIPVGSQTRIVPDTERDQSHSTAKPPRFVDVFIHALFHALLCALAAVILHALWTRATARFPFYIFLAWTIIFYILFIILAWCTRPPRSIIAFVVGQPHTNPSATAAAVEQVESHSVATPFVPASGESDHLSGSTSPYLHQPPYRSTFLSPREEDHASASQAGARSHDGYYGDDEDDEDEETRQSRMEAELNRRQVAIVTVPKQRLFVANAT